MRIHEVLRDLKAKGKKALMAHFYFGDPTEDFSIALAKALEDTEADLLEIGIPFSDPIADGPTFISACERALRAWTTPRSCLNGIKKLRSIGIASPIVLTTYYNIPFIYGIEKFLRDAKEAGASGLIIPDLPVEEATELRAAAEEVGIDLILLIAPTTSDERMKKILKASTGFVYVVNVEGVTGKREVLPPSTLQLIQRVKEISDKPIMAGFGISSPEQVRALISAGADGVIVGSAIAEIYSKNINAPESTLPEIASFMKRMKAACGE